MIANNLIDRIVYVVLCERRDTVFNDLRSRGKTGNRFGIKGCFLNIPCSGAAVDGYVGNRSP